MTRQFFFYTVIIKNIFITDWKILKSLEMLASSSLHYYEVIRFTCEACEKEERRTGCLNKRIMQMHKDMKYPCDKCEYVPTLAENLKEHIEGKHAGI